MLSLPQANFLHSPSHSPLLSINMDSDDLTASHWDDILAPRKDDFSGFGSTYVPPPASSAFGDFSDSPFAAKIAGDSDEDYDESDHNAAETAENEDEGDEEHPLVHQQYLRAAQSAQIGGNSVLEQQADIRHTHRAEQNSHLMAELTQNLDESRLESPQPSPAKIEAGSSLFADNGSPVRSSLAALSPAKSTSTASAHISPRKVLELKQGHRLFTAPRVRKYSSQVLASHLGQGAVNEAQDDSGPVEPLDDPLLNAEYADELVSGADKPGLRAAALVEEAEAPLYGKDVEGRDREGKNGTGQGGKITDASHIPGSRSLQPSGATHSTQSQTQRHQNSHQHKPDHPGTQPQPEHAPISISVGDPMKVGDITTAHIVYSIRTDTTSPSFPSHSDTFTVTRRYRDFRWIYHQLQNNHLGVIVPPPPTKQTYIGRFNENFIEGRRLSLEKMLTRIASLPLLRDDADFVCFLLSDDFVRDARERERLGGVAVDDEGDDRPAGSSSNSAADVGSAASSIGGSVAALASAVGTVGTGFMSLFSMATKTDEPDAYFADKKTYIEDLETNLKALFRALDTIAAQRVDLVALADEIAAVSHELAAVEILRASSDVLAAFGDVHQKLRDNIDRVNLQDSLTLSFTIEEYLRIIGSINHVFDARAKVLQQSTNLKQELVKKQTQLDKSALRKLQQEKAELLRFEVDKLQAKAEASEKLFNQMSATFRDELEKFELERIDDFRNSVEIFIEGSIESQKESIELWETFYERQDLESVK